MPICHAIGSIQRLNRQIKSAELIYCDEEPFGKDVVINLTNEGIRLSFDSESQRLAVIEVTNLRNVILRYCSSVFSSPSEPASLAKVEQAFGATRPGVYDAKQQTYAISWRGVSFFAPVEPALQQNYTLGLSALQLPDGSSPPVARLCIFSGASLSNAKAPPLPLPCFSGGCHADAIRGVRRGGRVSGLALTVRAEAACSQRLGVDSAPERLDTTVWLGDSQERVLSCLGAPSRVFYKSEDKMRIHRPSGDRRTDKPTVDFFFNYFTLALDVLFDGETLSAKKFVLHTNLPGHFDFGIYNRCHFEIEVDAVDADAEDVAASAPPPKSFTLTPFTNWREVASTVCGAEPRQPVVLNRAPSNSAGENPFGATFCYGQANVIVEVMANGYVAAVTLFDARAAL